MTSPTPGPNRPAHWSRTTAFALAWLLNASQALAMSTSDAEPGSGLQQLFSDSLVGALLTGQQPRGLGLLDLVCLGALAALFLLRPTGGGQDAPPGQPQDPADDLGPPVPPEGAIRRARAEWARISGTAQPSQGPHAQQDAAELPAPARSDGSFDEAEFLRGAKLFYAKFQESWDAHDLGELRDLITPEVFASLSQQLSATPRQGTTDILLIDAALGDVERRGSLTVAKVRYEVLQRAAGSVAQEPQTVRETWHFRRDEAAARPQWVLAAIEGR